MEIREKTTAIAVQQAHATLSINSFDEQQIKPFSIEMES
jgi:hypothetical protein